MCEVYFAVLCPKANDCTHLKDSYMIIAHSHNRVSAAIEKSFSKKF